MNPVSAVWRGLVPGWRRRVRTPVFLQQEIADCGAACLGIVLAHHGYWATLDELRDACGTGRDGCTAADIVTAAEAYGLRMTGWRREPRHLPKLPLPIILFWEFNHFVVLEGIGRNRYHVNDPASGHRSVDREEFDRAFTGVVLVPESTEGFRRGGNRPGAFRQLWPWLAASKRQLAFAGLCALLLVLPGLALPLLLSVFVDRVLVAGNGGVAAAVVAAAVAAAAATYLLTWLNRRLLRRLGIRLSIEHGDLYFTRLLRLPMHFHARHLAGDLANRMHLIDNIANAGAMHLVTLTIEAVTSLAFLALVFVFDAPSGLALAALGLLLLALTRLVVARRDDLNLRLVREQGELAGHGMAGLRNLEHLQATATEASFFSRWSGYQARELSVRQRFAEIGHVGVSFPDLFLMLGAAAVFGLGGWRAMNGDITIGTLAGLYVVAGNFLRPVCRIAQFADMFQVLNAHLQRVNEILRAPAASGARTAAREAPGAAGRAGGLRLAGRIELRDVTFGFQRNQPPLIENFSLRIEPGQRVAVVGASGSGKSTLALLVAGVYEPWSGEILFDGAPRGDIPDIVLHHSVSIVDQHPFLFAASVRENLTLWNPAAPEEMVVAAARDAAIHDDILARPQGYDSPVEEGGRNFSGGERQRLEIARALVYEPSVLILDEATSALDAGTEHAIDDAVRRRGCSCLIVAHRLSTVRDSDRIVVMAGGRQVEAGTHEELAVAGGIYQELIRDA